MRPGKTAVGPVSDEVSEWVFPWRPRGESPVPKWIAVGVVAVAFAFLLSSVRVRMAGPATWTMRKGAVIHVSDDAQGRALRLRAMEGGPFPSRFEPTEWGGARAIEREALEAARGDPAPYIPKLRELDAKQAPVLPIVTGGESVLPQRQAPKITQQPVENTRLVPLLRPLSGVAAAAMPESLPPVTGVIDPALTTESNRFLLRVDGSGVVVDCIALAGNSEAEVSTLQRWLRGVTFKAGSGNQTRWIAVGLTFTNQPADGPDAD